MAEVAVWGRVIRFTGDSETRERSLEKKKAAARQRRRQLVEASRIHTEFVSSIDRCQDAYVGKVDQFGLRGNVVDSWRLQFNRR
jgi:hypothetical protein